MVLLSRDIEKKFKLKFGDYVYIENFGLFEFQDRMNKRKIKSVDVFMWNIKKAVKFGKQKKKIWLMKRR